jgi:hypothetical protein
LQGSFSKSLLFCFRTNVYLYAFQLYIFSIKKVGNLFARVTGSSQNASRGVSPADNNLASMPASTDSQSGAFSAFRRSYSQMSSFRQSSVSSFSQHAWTSNSNSQSANMSKDRGGSKQFVWRSESNPASILSKSNNEVSEINNSSSQSGTTGAVIKGARRAQSVPMESMKQRKRSHVSSSSGALFDALSSFKPNKKKK